MMTVFVGLILFMIVVFMIVNGSFLEKYYISNKKSEFIKAYTMVQEGVENGTINSETPEKDLGRFTEKNNISIAVIDSEYNVVYTNVRTKYKDRYRRNVSLRRGTTTNRARTCDTEKCPHHRTGRSDCFCRSRK